MEMRARLRAVRERGGGQEGWWARGVEARHVTEVCWHSQQHFRQKQMAGLCQTGVARVVERMHRVVGVQVGWCISPLWCRPWCRPPLTSLRSVPLLPASSINVASRATPAVPGPGPAAVSGEVLPTTTSYGIGEHSQRSLKHMWAQGPLQQMCTRYRAQVAACF